MTLRDLKGRAKRYIKSAICIPKFAISAVSRLSSPVTIAFTATIFLSTSPALADDVGITKGRLIQESEKSYLLEADVSRNLVWAIKAPIFPDRFQVSELEFVNQAGWIVVQARATTTGESLTPADGILLPWLRNGAALTVQLLDGSVSQGLFLRTLEGIRVPLQGLMPSERSVVEICREHLAIGGGHLSFKWIHLFWVGILAAGLAPRRLLLALLYYSFGQALALVLADFGLPGVDLLFADILGALLVLLLAGAVARQASIQPYLPLLFLYGVLHSLAYAQSLKSFPLPMDRRLPALLMFNLAIDVGHYAFAIIFMLPGMALKKWPHGKKVAAYAGGVYAVAILALLFQEHVATGDIRITDSNGSRIATRYNLPVSQKPSTVGQRPAGARRLTNPIMSYLTVEPYEVRQEILIQARAAVQILGVDDRGMGSIPLQSLESVKAGILEAVQEANSITIDGQAVRPVLARADFVTLGPVGVMLRSEPVDESLDNGIVGLTLVYETPELADEILIHWRLFLETVAKIEATVTDPFGGSTMILSAEENQWHWKRRISGYRVPVIEEIAVEKQKLPAVSMLLFAAVAGLFMLSKRFKKTASTGPLLLGVAALGFVLYPFARTPVALPWAAQWKPSVERTAIILDGLLTNVYRAFDVRDENRVYDRLATSVAGDQLSRIYLQNRKSLELENRGGARANVDDVEIISILTVKKSKPSGFSADAVWTVSGSVSHFGHTHYRRNKNHALVTFVIDDGFWKIKDIELIDEKRLL